MYTNEEKARLISFLKEDCNNRIRQLEEECQALAEETESKILRRLNNVSATLWNVKVKDVLMIERHHKPSIKHLIADIRAAKQELSFLSSGDPTQNSSNNLGIERNLRLSKERLRSVSDSRVNKTTHSSRPRTASSHH